MDVLGDHDHTRTTHSGAKKSHDWTVEKLADLFGTTQMVKTQEVPKSLRPGVSDGLTLSFLPTWVMLMDRYHW